MNRKAPGGFLEGFLGFIVLGKSETLLAVSQYSQQHQEKIDKIQIEAQRADNGTFAYHTRIEAGGLTEGHVLQLLGIING